MSTIQRLGAKPPNPPETSPMSGGLSPPDAEALADNVYRLDQNLKTHLLILDQYVSRRGTM